MENKEENNELMDQNTKFKGVMHYIKLITVEPVMFLYMLAFMLTSVVEQAFFIHRACSVDLGYSEEVCADIEDFPDEKKKVQAFVAVFYQYNNIAFHVIPLILALFLGAWSDKHGGARKAPLLIGLAGKFLYSAMIAVNATQTTWPLYTVLYTATLPSAATGADLAIFMACFSYMADITSSEDRTVRITLLQVAYLVTIPTGVALGQMLFTKTGENVAICFATNASLVATALIYSAFRLRWKSAPNMTSCDKVPISRFCCDFFDKNHLVQTIRAVVKKRPGHRRAYLAALLIAMALYTFQRDESSMMYLYTQLVFDWDTRTYSSFRTYQSGVYVIGTLIGLPLITKVFKLPDSAAILIGAAAHASARVVFVLAEVPWLLYAGATLAAMGPVVAPVLKSMVSKVVPVRERGKVQAVLASADNAVPLFSGVIYTQVYNATMSTFPAAVFLVTFGSQIIVILLLGAVQLSLGKKDLDDGESPPLCDPAENKQICPGPDPEVPQDST